MYEGEGEKKRGREERRRERRGVAMWGLREMRRKERGKRSEAVEKQLILSAENEERRLRCSRLTVDMFRR